MQRQFALMSLPRPEQVVVDIEGVVRDYLVPAPPAPGSDLPPKYEDVEEDPPTYDENTMGAAGNVEAGVEEEAGGAVAAEETIATEEKDGEEAKEKSRA